MAEGESRVPMGARGVENVVEAVAEAREKVATVNKLVELLSNIDAVNVMHTRLLQTTKYLEKQALQGSPAEQKAAVEDLSFLAHFLESAQKDPSKVKDVLPVLDRIEREAAAKSPAQEQAAA